VPHSRHLMVCEKQAAADKRKDFAFACLDTR